LAGEEEKFSFGGGFAREIKALTLKFVSKNPQFSEAKTW